MPRVPTYQPNQVREDITPRVQDTTDPRFEQVGRGFAQQAEAFGQAGSQLTKAIGEVQQRKAEAEFFNAEQDLIRSQVDVSNMFKGIKGDKVKQIADEEQGGLSGMAQKAWQERVDAVKNKYKDSDVLELIDTAAKKRSTELYKDSVNHEISELEQWEQQSKESYAKLNRDYAIENYQDPERVNDGIAKQELAINLMADDQGWAPAVRKAKLDEAKSQTRLGIVNQMIADGQDQIAKDFFDKFEGEFTAEDKLKATKLVEDASLMGESQRESDKIFLKHESMSDALDAARGIKDPKLRDETVKRVKDRFAEKKKAEDMDTEGLHRRATDFLDETPDVDLYAQKNPADWSRFSLSQRSALRSYAKKKKGGAFIETDPNTYYDLLNMMTGPIEMRNAFMSTNLADPKYLSKLDESDREFFMKKQAEMRAGKRGSAFIDSVRTNKQIVDDLLKSVDLDPRTKNEKELQRINRFRSELDQQLRAYQEETGKKATKEDTERIANDLLFKVTTDRRSFWFDEKKFLFELEPGDQVEVDYDEIPKMERHKIEAEYRKHGLDFTEEDVINTFIDVKLNKAASRGL